MTEKQKFELWLNKSDIDKEVKEQLLNMQNDENERDSGCRN